MDPDLEQTADLGADTIVIRSNWGVDVYSFDKELISNLSTVEKIRAIHINEDPSFDNWSDVIPVLEQANADFFFIESSEITKVLRWFPIKRRKERCFDSMGLDWMYKEWVHRIELRYPG